MVRGPALAKGDPTKVDLLPEKIHSAGLHVVPDSLSVPDDDDRYQLRVELPDRPKEDRHVCTCRAEVSIDGGTSWGLLCSFEAWGRDPSIVPIQGDGHSWMEVDLPDKIGRMVRTVLDAKEDLLAKLECTTIFKDVVRQQGKPPASVSFDAVSSTDFAGVQNPSWTHTPSGTPTSVMVGVSSAYEDGSDLTAITSITYGGGACTQQVTLSAAPGAVNLRSSIWGRGSPATGAQTVQVNFTTNLQYGGAGANTFVGSDTSTLTSATATGSGSGSNPSASCTTASDEVVMDCVTAFTSGGPTLTVGTSQTERWNRINAGASTRTASSTQLGSTENPAVMTWTQSAGSWVQTAASVKAGASPPATGWGQLMGQTRNRLVYAAG